MEQVTLLEKKFLTHTDAVKQVWHIRLDISKTNIHYQPGDILCLFVPNSDQLVEEILTFFNLDRETKFTLKKVEHSVKNLLKYQFELGKVSFDLLKHLATLRNDEYLLSILLNKIELESFLYGKNNLDILQYFNAQDLDFLTFIDLLAPLTARSYSIASSPLRHPKEIDLTIGQESFNKNGEKILSHTSSYLEKLNIGDEIKVEHLPNPAFKLPQLNDNILMIGAGTGIAPYIGFLQEREYSHATGRNWLIFGNRNQDKDFLYKQQLEYWQQNGLLNRLDAVFSRDHLDKVYVQHIIKEHSDKIWQHIENNGFIFICGDAIKMAKAVDQVLVNIIENNTELDNKQSKKFLLGLKKTKRYMRDVY